MQLNPCSQCHKNQTVLTCGICACAVCKSCAQILEPGSFSFSRQIPEAWKSGTFCGPCYEAEVAAPLAEYFEILERAKNIDVYFKKQGKETRLIKRTEKPVSISARDDRDEVVMGLAFLAAEGHFNAVVDVDLISEKVGVGSYQKLQWRGRGVPAKVDARMVVHDKSIWHNPN